MAIAIDNVNQIATIIRSLASDAMFTITYEKADGTRGMGTYRKTAPADSGWKPSRKPHVLGQKAAALCKRLWKLDGTQGWRTIRLDRVTACAF
jgi:hypothetical protein